MPVGIELLVPGPHDVWGPHHHCRNILAICSTAKLINHLNWAYVNRQLLCKDFSENLPVPWIQVSAVHDVTPRLQSRVVQLTKDGRMFQTDWAPREWWLSAACLT